MKNNELKDELKFVTSLVQILKKNKLNTIELNRTFGEFDTVSIKVDGGAASTSVIKQGFSYPNKEIGLMEEPQKVNSQEKSKNIKEGSVVNSPMVGTVYLAPSPEEKNFVEIGQTIKKEGLLLNVWTRLGLNHQTKVGIIIYFKCLS